MLLWTKCWYGAFLIVRSYSVCRSEKGKKGLEPDSLWEINSAVELILGDIDSMWRSWRFQNVLVSSYVEGGGHPYLSTHFQHTNNMAAVGQRVKSRFLLKKLTFYGTWPTRFHTWFLLNFRVDFSPHNSARFHIFLLIYHLCWLFWDTSAYTGGGKMNDEKIWKGKRALFKYLKKR